MSENEWDKRFSAPGYAYGELPNDFLRSMVGKLPSGQVLSLGDGEGRNGVFLASQGFEVTSVDSSAVGLQKAQDLATTQHVQLHTVLADLAGYRLPRNVFSGIVSIFCHLPATIRRDVHRQVVDVLLPGGAFVLEAYRPEQLNFRTGGPPVRELLVTLDDLRTELQGLRFEVLREVDREIHEGRLHNGLSAVVQVVAFKP